MDTTRPPCPRCKSENVVSHGMDWLCNGCGRNWRKVYSIRDPLPSNRPPCPRCKSPQIISHGIDWKCKDCGRTWLKQTYPKRKIDDPDRPPCPSCGTPNPIKAATGRWKCKSCGKSWNMDLGMDILLTLPMEVLNG